MTSQKIKLKYTDTILDFKVFNSGLKYCPDVDIVYKQSKLRDKIIFKYDLIQALQDYFLSETLETHRDSIYGLMLSELYSEDELSDIIIELLTADEKFRLSMNDLFFACQPDSTIGDYIIFVLSTVVLNYVQHLREVLKGRSEFVIDEMNGYVYISAPDNYNTVPLEILNNKYEVVNNGKNWQYQN